MNTRISPPLPLADWTLTERLRTFEFALREGWNMGPDLVEWASLVDLAGHVAPDGWDVVSA